MVATNQGCVPLASARSSQCEQVFMITGTGVHDQTDWTFTITGMRKYFKPFLHNLLALQLSRQTLRRHRDNIWALGGELIRALQMDSDLRRRPIEQVVLSLIGDDGGPLLSHGQSETEQRAFDATCRKLSRFLADPMISRAAPLEALQQRRTDCAIDGTNANRPATRVAVKPRSRAAVRRRRRA